MNIKHILCPIDFSDFNSGANEYASALAKSTGAKITYLHVFLPDAYTAPPEFYDAEKEVRTLTKKLESFIKPTSSETETTYSVCSGTAANTIIQYATEHDVDLIVLGTHGRTGLMRVLMGSVAEAVVRKSDCPVLAIKAANNVMHQE